MKEDKEPLLESAVCLYLSCVEDACALREIEVVSRAHNLINKETYQTEIDYYNALTEYIIENL